MVPPDQFVGGTIFVKTELPGLSGHLTVTETVSYASQEPWIFSGSIRDNILFGYPFDSERYWQVIHNCSLKEDIDSFTEGDMSDRRGGSDTEWETEGESVSSSCCLPSSGYLPI